jgi:hypothetical protein
VFDQWVPDEPAPRAPLVKVRAGEVLSVAGQVAQGVAWNLAHALLGLPAYLRAAFGRLRRGELGHEVWAHAASILCAVLVIGAATLAPQSAQSQRPGERMRLFHMTGGDLSDKGMAALVRLDPVAAAIAFRVSPLPPAPFAGPDDGNPNDAAQNPPTLDLPGMTPEEARLINAALPFSSLPIRPAQPFFLAPTNLLDETRAVDCLTAAIYYEAANEPKEGLQAVAQVILNRVRHKAFPKSVCGVVFQGSNRTTGCQFSFTCDGSLYRKPSDRGWARSREVAIAALNGFVYRGVGDATHYHADYVAPYWSTSMYKIVQIGAHIFYKWTGGMGEPRSFNGLYAGGEPFYNLAGLDLTNAANLDVTFTAFPGADATSAITAGAEGGTSEETPEPVVEAPVIELKPAEPVVAPAETPKAEPKKPEPPKRSEWRRLPTSRSW